jgi:hypothetical protein
MESPKIITENSTYEIKVTNSSPQNIDSKKVFFVQDNENKERKSFRSKSPVISRKKDDDDEMPETFKKFDRKLTEKIKAKVDFDSLMEDDLINKYLFKK